jgi:multidrug efflux pump subunit AcrA (membrane-fusion protein)
MGGHHVPDDLKARLDKLDEPVTAPPTVQRSWRAVIVGITVMTLVAAIGYWGWQQLRTPDGPPKNLELQSCERGDVVLSYVGKGELEAARNTEIVCLVRASGRGSTAATSIKWVIDDGTKVHKGDLLVLLEDASLREQLATQHVVVEGKIDLYEQARANLKITENENHSAELTALNNLEIAKIDLEKFLKAERAQKQYDIDSRIKLATANLIQWRDKLGWSNRMFNRGYLSANQKLSDETNVDQAVVNLDKLDKELETLKFDNRRSELDLLNKCKQAELALQVAKETAAAKKAQALATLTSAELILKQESTKQDDLEQDVRNCRIVAPHDGMVIYYIPESMRYNSSQQVAIEPGTPVKEGQKLMRIPDLGRMVARVKIDEAIVAKLRGDQMAATGFGACYDLGQSLSMIPHLVASQGTPGVHTGLAASMPGLIGQREIKTDYSQLDEEIVVDGMPANLKVPSIDRPLAGHVKMVSAVASQSDWMSSDVKVFPTLVSIDEPIEGLKPNMSAEVTVKIDERKNVIRLPVQAVLESGGKKFCYVKHGNSIDKKTVNTGLNNYKFVEITDGSELQEKDLVVLNARSYAEKVGDLQGNVSIDPSSLIKDRHNRKRPDVKNATAGKMAQADAKKPDAPAPASQASNESSSARSPAKDGSGKSRAASGAGH